MNTPFQDTFLSSDNLRLYLETPESELIKNVNPSAQQTAIISKRLHSQSPSPQSKLKQAKNRCGKLSLHLLPKLPLNSIHNYELIQQSTQRNEDTQQCQPRIDYLRCNSLRSLSPSQHRNQRYQQLQTSQSQLLAEDQAAASREAFMRMKYMNTMKNTFCLRNQFRSGGSQREFIGITEPSFEFSPNKGLKIHQISQNQLEESNQFNNQEEQLNQDYEYADFGMHSKVDLSKGPMNVGNTTPKKKNVTKSMLPSKWISSNTKYDKLLYLMNKDNKQRLNKEENSRTKRKFISNEGFNSSSNITTNDNTTNPYFSLFGVSSKSIFNKEQLQLLNSQRLATRSYQYLPAKTLRSFPEKRNVTTSSEQESFQEINSQLELQQQNSAPAAEGAETPVIVQSPRKRVLEFSHKVPFMPPQVITSERKLQKKQSYYTRTSLWNLIQQQDLSEKKSNQNHKDAEIQGSQNNNNINDSERFRQGQNRRIIEMNQQQSVNGEKVNKKLRSDSGSVQNLHSSSLKKGIYYKDKYANHSVNDSSDQILEIAGKSKGIRQQQQPSSSTQRDDFMEIFQMSKQNMQRQLAQEAEQIRKLDNLVEEQFMRQKQIEQAREAERQLKKQMERGFCYMESEIIDDKMKESGQQNNQKDLFKRFQKGSLKSQQQTRFKSRLSSQSSVQQNQEKKTREFEISSGNVRMKFIRIDNAENFMVNGKTNDKSSSQLKKQEQLLLEDKVKSGDKVVQRERGGDFERLTEEKEIFNGWEETKEEEIVEDGKNKIDVISDIHRVIGSLGSESQSEQRNKYDGNNNLDQKLVISYVQRASMEGADNLKQETFKQGFGERNGDNQGDGIVEGSSQVRNSRVTKFLRPLLLKDKIKKNNKIDLTEQIQKEDNNTIEGQLEDIPTDLNVRYENRLRTTEIPVITMKENQEINNNKIEERNQSIKIADVDKVKEHKLQSSRENMIINEDIGKQGQGQLLQREDQYKMKDTKEKEDRQDKEGNIIRRSSQGINQDINKGQYAIQKQEYQQQNQQLSLSQQQGISISDDQPQHIEASQEQEDFEQKNDDSDSIGEDGFKLKKKIDFEKLKALRDKTINRFNVQNNQRKPPGFAAVVAAAVQAHQQQQQQTNSQAGNSLTKQKTSKLFKKNNKNKTSKKEEKKDSTVIEILSEEQKKQAKQREQDIKIAQKLEQIKEKVNQGVKVIINDTIERKLEDQKSRSKGQQHMEEINLKSDDGLIVLNSRDNLDNSNKEQSVEEYHTAVMELYSTCIDDLRRETGNNKDQINPSNLENKPSEHDLELQKMKHFDDKMSASIGKTVEMELRKTNLNEGEIDRFKYIYEINTKVHVLYSGIVTMLGGADKVRKLVIAVLGRIASHLPMLPIVYEWNYEMIHRRIIPGICALLCDDQQFFLRNLRQFTKVHEFSFIDFCFAKRETFLFLTGNKSRKLFPELSDKLILGVIQKIESVRRYLFPVKILADEEIRYVITQGLINCEEFVKLFKVNKLTTEFLGNLLNQLFDYFYSDVYTDSAPKPPKIRDICQPLLAQNLSRKLLDYIEIFTLKALQKERFTLNLILRDLHYKFSKVRLRLGFKQGIFGHFDTFQEIDKLIEQLQQEVNAAIHYGAADFLPETQVSKIKDLKFLKIYLKFLLAEHDIFSVFDIAVAMPYDGVTQSHFLFWMDCLRSVILTKYNFLPAQAHVFIRFIEACCPTQ